ncbi:MAG: hypothetical protein HY047_19895 [Acidobacteria bacterium]|nr:hypothetical protein [Acidobacteriota bacterium]
MISDAGGKATSARTAWAVFGLLVLGALFRLYGLTAMEFKGDEQEALNLGIGLLEQHPWSSTHPFPTQGMLSSNGVANAPLFTWIVAAAWAATRGPVAVTRLVALTNVACLYPLWLWARRRMDDGRALLTLALCAVSPFAVIFSRKIWTQDLLLPGVLSVVWGVEWWRGGRPWRGVVLFGLAALLVGQLHQSGAIAVMLLPMALAVQWRFDRWQGWTFRLGRPSRGELLALAAVLAINLFFWLPYLDYFARLPPEVLANRPKEILRPLLLRRVEAQVMPLDLFFFFAPDRQDFLRDAFRSAFYCGSIGLGAPLFVYGVWRWLRSPFSLPVIGVWWWLVIAAFTLARIPCYPFYVLALAPLTAVLASGAFDGPRPRAWLARLMTAWRVAYVVAMLGLTCVTGTWITGRGGAAGDYGVAYAVREAQAKSIVGRLASERINHFYENGEVRPGERVTLSCHGLPVEVTWIVRWMNLKSAETAHTLGLCDDWIEQQGRLVYRWALRDAQDSLR